VLTPGRLACLASWPGLSSLKVLELRGWAPDAEGLKALVESPHLGPGTSVGLAGVPLSAELRQVLLARLGGRFAA
jgi:hypothetical protein